MFDYHNFPRLKLAFDKSSHLLVAFKSYVFFTGGPLIGQFHQIGAPVKYLNANVTRDILGKPLGRPQDVRSQLKVVQPWAILIALWPWHMVISWFVPVA